MSQEKIKLSDGSTFTLYTAKKFHFIITNQEISGATNDAPIRLIDSPKGGKILQFGLISGTPSNKLLEYLLRQRVAFPVSIRDDNTGLVYSANKAQVEGAPNFLMQPQRMPVLWWSIRMSEYIFYIKDELKSEANSDGR